MRGVTRRGDRRGDSVFERVTRGGDHSPPYPHGVRVTPGDTRARSLTLGVSPRLPAHHGRVRTHETVPQSRDVAGWLPGFEARRESPAFRELVERVRCRYLASLAPAGVNPVSSTSSVSAEPPAGVSTSPQRGRL